MAANTFRIFEFFNQIRVHLREVKFAYIASHYFQIVLCLYTIVNAFHTCVVTLVPDRVFTLFSFVFLALRPLGGAGLQAWQVSSYWKVDCMIISFILGLFHGFQFFI